MRAHKLIRQAGLSLIEILVAMALGLVVLAGATNLFLGSSRTFEVNESLSRMQEDARFALNRVERDVRMAGFRGCTPTDGVVNSLNQTDDDYLAELYGGNPLLGWEAVDTGPGNTIVPTNNQITTTAAASTNWSLAANPSGGSGLAVPNSIVDGGIVTGNDILVLNSLQLNSFGASIQTGGGSSDNNPFRLNNGDVITTGQILFIVEESCSTAELFQQTNNSGSNNPDRQNILKGTGGSVTPGNIGSGTPQFSFDVTDGTQIYQQRSVAYFIRLNAEGIPSLYERRLDSGNRPAVELVRGVESFQVLYGIAASNNSTVAAEYVTAEEVTNWQEVVSVRLAMLLRSSRPVGSQMNQRVFNLLGTQVNPTGGATADPTGDRNIRILVTKTISLRNRIR